MATDSVWHLHQNAAVHSLRVHFEGDQHITFKEDQEANISLQDANCSEVADFFAYNAANPDTQIKHVYIPKHLVCKAQKETDKASLNDWKSSYVASTEWRWAIPNHLHHNYCKWSTSLEDILTDINTIH